MSRTAFDILRDHVENQLFLLRRLSALSGLHQLDRMYWEGVKQGLKIRDETTLALPLLVDHNLQTVKGELKRDVLDSLRGGSAATPLG